MEMDSPKTPPMAPDEESSQTNTTDDTTTPQSMLDSSEIVVKVDEAGDSDESSSVATHPSDSREELMRASHTRNPSSTSTVSFHTPTPSPKDDMHLKVPSHHRSASQGSHPNPPTPQFHRNHTGRTPMHQASRLSARSSFSAPGTPHSVISNPRYDTPEEGSTLGLILEKYPVLMWFLCCLTPLAYLLLIFGAIPIGERKEDDEDDDDRIHRYWIFTTVVNPINMTVIAFLNSGIFLSCMGVMRPFRVHWSVPISVFVVELVVFSVIVPFAGAFDFIGVASLFLCYGVTFVAIYCYETWKLQRLCKDYPPELANDLRLLHKNFWQFVKVAISFLIFFLIMLLFVWAYQHVGSGVGQKLLPFGMTIGVFVIRKVMLALTDEFPLTTAMLISGFWVENIYDMFQTMAYRSVKLPVNYVSVWFTNALSLLANLVFLTDTWFSFRIWIKAYLPLMFTGKCCPYKLGVEADETEDEDERGHSNNRIGYHRRQARFFMYKCFSKCVSACFYFLISTVLRFGVNRHLFPFASDSEEEYENSLQFSFYNLIFLVLAGFGAGLFVRYQHPKLFQYFKENRYVLKSRFMLGAVVALLINNGIIAISMMMFFNQIYYVVHAN